MASGAATKAALANKVPTRPASCDARRRERRWSRDRPPDEDRPRPGEPALSEYPFVDDEDVTGQNHHILRAPLGDVGNRKDVRLDLAADLAAKVDGVLCRDARETTGARDGVHDGHVGIVGHLA